MHIKTLLLVTMVSLVGCTVGPDYVRPDIKTASAYQGHNVLAARAVTTPAPSIDAWWKGFDDPELETIVGRVLAQNLDLAASSARVLQARAVAQEASADRLPSGELTGDATRERQSVYSPIGKIASAFPGYERKQTLEDVGAGASWELDLAGGLRRQSQVADAEFEAARQITWVSESRSLRKPPTRIFACAEPRHASPSRSSRFTTKPAWLIW